MGHVLSAERLKERTHPELNPDVSLYSEKVMLWLKREVELPINLR